MIHSLFLASGLPDEAHKKTHHRKSYGGYSREDSTNYIPTNS